MINSKLYFVMDTTLYSSLLGGQVILFFAIRNGSRKRLSLLINVILLLIIPFLFITTLPAYTYEGGKKLIEKQYPEDDLTFISNKHHLLPLNENYSWFIRNYAYYYQIEHAGEKLFYGIKPTNGEVFQLKEDFWVK